MKLLRGLGELGTITLMVLTINVSGLQGQTITDEILQDNEILNNAVSTMEYPEVRTTEQSIKTENERGDGDKLVDASTIALAGALFNFALDIIDHKNAYAYIKEQFKKLYKEILERLPGFIATPTTETAQNIIADAINDITLDASDETTTA